MSQSPAGSVQKFRDVVGLRFQLYNSLFLSLPYRGIEKTGILLSLFLSVCEEGFENGLSPTGIIERFFRDHMSVADDSEKLDTLFRFVQYAERQVVLFDALEDAAFRDINDMNGPGTMKQLTTLVRQNDLEQAFEDQLGHFSVRPVLTAHPTQFYPGSVLGIINDLADAIARDDVASINTLLQQLGRTPFFKKQKPTPFDEATSLIWYLENVFYEAAGEIMADIRAALPDVDPDFEGLIRMGFWSGGDRDGNPFVTVETTIAVAEALRNAILKCYYRDLRSLRRRLTFSGVESAVSILEGELYSNILEENPKRVTTDSILGSLIAIRDSIINEHGGLFVELVERLIDNVKTFGLYFASLDIRQEASVHGRILDEISQRTDLLPDGFAGLSDDEKIGILLGQPTGRVDPDLLESELARDTLRTIAAVARIRRENGEKACERYIISQCQSAVHAIEVFGLFRLGGWRTEDLTIDIVPLFETITDLGHAADIMRKLYEIPEYREHLRRRRDVQTIMLGFSDGTKDGGYLMANWSIYKAKDELTRLSREHGVHVVFFDGRGGPPARGGGKTHKFFSSMGRNVENKEIQLTIQGQTVSSNFGTVEAARFNIEQLLNAGLHNRLFPGREKTFGSREESLMHDLAERSLDAYEELKNDPEFLNYLSRVSPLRFYSQTNIGSRPAKRGASKELTLGDLRAIPFVGAWSQLKQNVPGYYGVGTAIESLRAEGRFEEVKVMYRHNQFFKTLLDNCEMAMQKTFFPLTAWLADDRRFGSIWNKVHDEFELTKRCIFEISGNGSLMADHPVEQQSVSMRERIVLPLTAIQQFAIATLNRFADEDVHPDSVEAYEKLAMRCSFGIINAGRNSA